MLFDGYETLLLVDFQPVRESSKNSSLTTSKQNILTFLIASMSKNANHQLQYLIFM